MDDKELLVLAAKAGMPATIYGFPAAWFEECNTLLADVWIRNGVAYVDGCGGGATPMRMKHDYRAIAGWSAKRF